MSEGPSQGMNLAGRPGAYADSFISLDLMKGVDGWRYFDPAGPVNDPYVPTVALDLDAKGWLKHLPVVEGEAREVWGNVFYTDKLPPGKYIVEWQGEGSLSTFQNFTQIAPNKILVDYLADYTDEAGNPKQDGISLIMSANDPNGTGDYLHDIKLYREQDADLIAAGEDFNPTWFDRIDDFRVLRAHDWQSTNFPSTVDWHAPLQRADQGNWGANDGRGMPYELLVQIANETRSDLWINIPHTASDQFMIAAARYVNQHLDPDLRLHVEFSNEYWTTGFDQYDYFIAGGAEAFGGAKFAAGQFYGTRAAHMADIFAAEFGTDAMLRPVLTVNHGMFASGEAKRVLETPAAVAQGGTSTVSHGFDVLATDGYLGWWGPDPEMGARIHGWMLQADGGFGAARDFLLAQLQNDLLPAWQKGRALADQYGLQFMIYEGGTLLLNDGNADPTLTDFALRFSRSTELKAVYEATLAAWASVGSGPFAWYSDVGRAGPWGDYGHWKGIDFLPDPRADTITDANENTPPWWTGDDRPQSHFDNGAYRAGSEGTDKMRGTNLADRLYGLTGDDELQGFVGNDRLWGGAGNDRILGGQGRDDINGGDGDDRIEGGVGRDRILTGAGDDVIVFRSAQAGVDVVADFSAGGDDDSFALAAAGFGNHSLGRLLRREFQASDSESAATAAVRVIYDRDDHKLYWDADGSGAGAAVLLAELQAGARVTAADFLFF